MVLNLLNKVEEILQNKWIQRILNNFYYLFMGLILIICFTPYIFNYFGTSYININDAKNVINLLVQSEAAVIAIVITLSLVAVQLAASSYSTRVIDIFKKSYSFWVIVGLYIIAIIYGIILLSVISVKNTYGIQNFIFIDYLIGIIAFISLIGFIWTTFDLLKPSTVLKKLAQDINKNKILEYINDNEKNEDPFQPIIDMINASLMKYDYRTLRTGLNAIKNKTNEVLKNKILNESEEDKLSHIISTHLRRTGMLAADRKDQDAIHEIINSIYLIGKVEFNTNVIKNIVSSLYYIGRKTIENELEGVTEKIIDHIGEIGIKTAAKDYDTAFLSLRVLGEMAAKRKFEDSVIMTMYHIGEYEKIAAEKKLINLLIGLESLGEILKSSIEQRLQVAPLSGLKILKEIGEKCIEEINILPYNKKSINIYTGKITPKIKLEVTLKKNIQIFDQIVDILIENQDKWEKTHFYLIKGSILAYLKYLLKLTNEKGLDNSKSIEEIIKKTDQLN